MKLQTQIPLEKHPNHLIGYDSNCLLLGSCFVENMGDKLDYFKFQNLQNPFGIIFNPRSIENLITNAIQEKEYSETDIFFSNEQWHCYDAHSKLSHTSKESLLLSLNQNSKALKQQIHDSTHVIITLGTAWVYKLNTTNQIVANCHKVPQGHFTKVLLSIQEISEALKRIVENIQGVNPNARFIITVSPIRHIKDGFIENTRSKAHLISAIHEFLDQQASIVNQQSFYFPSYEIMMDELRDYRFYAEDMLHPNTTAVNYIWEKFLQVWISSQALKTMSEVEAVQKGMHHKPFKPDAEAYEKFLQQLEAKKAELQTQFPHISF